MPCTATISLFVMPVYAGLYHRKSPVARRSSDRAERRLTTSRGVCAAKSSLTVVSMALID